MAERNYKTEFPDFDAEIPVIAGFEDSSWGNEGMPQLTNEVAGFRLWVDYADPKLSVMEEARLAGDAKRYSLLKIHDEFDIGKDEPILDSDDLDEIIAAYAKAWLQWVAVNIGLGFHPDTRAQSYEPGLESGLAAQYDPVIELVFERLEDPYEVGLSAWQAAGLIEGSTASP